MHGPRNRVSAIILVARREISEQTRFLESMHRLRNRVSAIILVARREISEETRFLEIMHRLRNRVSAIILVARRKISEETRFLEIYARAKFLEIIFLALKTIILKPDYITNRFFFANKTTLWYTTRL